jgi:hypothetical protein
LYAKFSYFTIPVIHNIWHEVNSKFVT